MDDPFVLDTGICPDCAAQIVAGAARCPSCGIALFGAPAAQLWEVSTEILRLAAQRRVLLRQMRAMPETDPAEAVAAAPVPTPPPPPAWSPAPPQQWQPQMPWAQPGGPAARAPRPRTE